MLLTRRRVLYGMEELQKMALGILDEAKEVEQRADKIVGPENPAAYTSEDARRMHADADKELTKSRCLQKLLQADPPSPEEAELGLSDARPAWELLEHRREFVSIHSINTKRKLQEAIWAAELQEREISNDPMDPVQEDLPEPEFVWDVQHDYSDHSDRCLDHLKRIIRLGSEDQEWVDAAVDPDLLSYSGKYALGYNLGATTDVLVAKRSAVRTLLPAKGAQVLFDLRKQVTSPDLIHGEIRLVLANLHAPAEKPVVVVTDLRGEWHILWMNGADICQRRFPTRANAVKVINDILAGSIEAGQGSTQAAIASRHRIPKHVFETAE
ncbi:g10813 [Coccomyxa viridis]|uniref:G10813 protein n=1 Tax=Coccomyxa viridis TaxID=1274662 RepID=A0ABP1G6F6_9CHLO